MTLSDPCKIHENHPAGRCDEHTLDMLTDFLFWNTKSKRCVNTDNRPLFHSDTTSLGQGLEFFDCTVSEKGKKEKKEKKKEKGCTLGLPQNRLVHSTPKYNVVCGAVFTDCSFIQFQNLENIHFFL